MTVKDSRDRADIRDSHGELLPEFNRAGPGVRKRGFGLLISLAGGRQEAVVVEESAEQVRKLIREARAEGQVKLSAQDTGGPVWINPAYVILVRPESPDQLPE